MSRRNMLMSVMTKNEKHIIPATWFGFGKDIEMPDDYEYFLLFKNCFGTNYLVTLGDNYITTNTSSIGYLAPASELRNIYVVDKETSETSLVTNGKYDGYGQLYIHNAKGTENAIFYLLNCRVTQGTALATRQAKNFDWNYTLENTVDSVIETQVSVGTHFDIYTPEVGKTYNYFCHVKTANCVSTLSATATTSPMTRLRAVGWTASAYNATLIQSSGTARTYNDDGTVATEATMPEDIDSDMEKVFSISTTGGTITEDCCYTFVYGIGTKADYEITNYIRWSFNTED